MPRTKGCSPEESARDRAYERTEEKNTKQKINSANEAALSSCSVSVIIHCNRPYAECCVWRRRIWVALRMGMRANAVASGEWEMATRDTQSNYNWIEESLQCVRFVLKWQNRQHVTVHTQVIIIIVIIVCITNVRKVLFLYFLCFARTLVATCAPWNAYGKRAYTQNCIESIMMKINFFFVSVSPPPPCAISLYYQTTVDCIPRERSP